MKKYISSSVFAGLLSLSSPVESNGVNDYNYIRDDTNNKVSHLLSDNEFEQSQKNYFNDLVKLNLSKNLVNTNNHLLFPSETISL